MFINNKYKTEYFKIINNSKHIIEERYEIHHIIPRSLGGDDSESNLIKVTIDDHFKLHILLPYFTEGIFREKMLYAWNMMANCGSKYSSTPEIYKELRTEYCEMLSIKMLGEGNPMYGIKGADNPNYGSKRTKEQKQNMKDNQPDRSKENNSMYGKIPSLKQRAATSAFNSNKVNVVDNNGNVFKVFTDDPRYISGELIAESKGRKYNHKNKREIIECPFCNKIGDISNMKRWHFENCKFKEKE